MDYIIMKDTTAHYVSIIKDAGYRVFMNNPQADEYCFYTDGTRIGYAQWSDVRGPYVSSVHVPDRMGSGCGFSVADEICPESLRAAITCHAPDWATSKERASVRKYPSWDAFHASNNWFNKLTEV